jgi:hypothetical protein
MSFTFYLGSHKPHWLAEAGVPLFVSFATLRDRDELWPAIAPWAMDSAGFMELRLRGTWTVPPSEYVSVVRRCVNEIGKLDWAAIQDWMCEPVIRAKTGLTVTQHQCLTIRSLLDLRSMAPELPWAPVLQGWAWPDYDRHVEMYARYGIDLTREPIVGVGSVCRRQNTLQAGTIFASLLRSGIQNLHGFGLKRSGLIDNAPLLRSSDSLAWSTEARLTDPEKSNVYQRWLAYQRKHLPGHSHGVDGKGKCNNCLDYALWWRKEVIRQAEEGINRDIWASRRVPWRDNPLEPVLVGTVGEHSFYGSKNGRWHWIDDEGTTFMRDAGKTERDARAALARRLGPGLPSGLLRFGQVVLPRPL